MLAHTISDGNFWDTLNTVLMTIWVTIVVMWIAIGVVQYVSHWWMTR